MTTPDPNNTLFSIQTGEQRSRGIELDVAGEILPGWKAIASYAHTDAEVTEDNATPVGNRLTNVPIKPAYGQLMKSSQAICKVWDLV